LFCYQVTEPGSGIVDWKLTHSLVGGTRVVFWNSLFGSQSGYHPWEDSSKSGDHHPGEDLAKSGYKTKYKLQIFNYATIFWLQIRRTKYRNLFDEFFPHFWGLKTSLT
jgi:hypothetical protein